MQKALSRLPEEEIYKRNYRFITAHQCSLSHHLLPPSKAVKPEEDKNYLIPYILEAEKEAFEKEELDNIQPTNKWPGDTKIPFSEDKQDIGFKYM